MHRLRTMLVRLVVSSIILGAIWLAGLLHFVSRIPHEVEPGKSTVQAAIVLTGGAKRIEHGLQRQEQKLAKKLLITGVNHEATPENVLAAVMPNPLPAGSDISIGYEARSTIGNAHEAQRWIMKHRIQSIRLITANYHMPRSEREFRFLLPPHVRIITDPVFPQGFDISRWVSDSNSRRLVLSEYHKYIAATIRHWLVRWQKL